MLWWWNKETLIENILWKKKSDNRNLDSLKIQHIIYKASYKYKRVNRVLAHDIKNSTKNKGAKFITNKMN